MLLSTLHCYHSRDLVRFILFFLFWGEEEYQTCCLPIQLSQIFVIICAHRLVYHFASIALYFVHHEMRGAENVLYVKCISSDNPSLIVCDLKI